MVYATPLADGLPPQTLTGQCTITTPVAVCSLTVDVPTVQVVVRPPSTRTDVVGGDTRETGRPRNGAVKALGTWNRAWAVALLLSGVVMLLVN